ncbi:hypothetical protein NQ315_016236, partial [Exocentrus adspersus]
MRNVNSERLSEFVYLGKTWVFENGFTCCRSWQDSSKKTVKTTKTDGKRYIILHAGNQNGFIPGASLIFCSKTNNPDYHGEMNKENFLRNLENKVPNTGWKKADICRWLTEHDVNCDGNLLKTQLLDLVAQKKPPKSYVVDKLVQQYGHTVLRLPPYHCIFNPIEHIWGIAKTYYNKHIGRDGYGVENTLKMWQEALDTITPQVWSNTIRHTEKEIQKWWNREAAFDREDTGPLIINVADGDSDAINMDDLDDIMEDDDEELVQFINEQRVYVVRNRPNNMVMWDNEEFFNRFRLSKPTVNRILLEIQNQLPHLEE